MTELHLFTNVYIQNITELLIEDAELLTIDIDTEDIKEKIKHYGTDYQFYTIMISLLLVINIFFSIALYMSINYYMFIFTIILILLKLYFIILGFTSWIKVKIYQNKNYDIFKYHSKFIIEPKSVKCMLEVDHKFIYYYQKSV